MLLLQFKGFVFFSCCRFKFNCKSFFINKNFSRCFRFIFRELCVGGSVFMGNWMGARKGVWQLVIVLIEQLVDVVFVLVKFFEEFRCIFGYGFCGQTLKVLVQVYFVLLGGKVVFFIGFIYRYRFKLLGFSEKEVFFF